MKSLVVCVSVSHGNTRKVADAMAEVLGAAVRQPEDVDVATLGDLDLVGFGSGIFWNSFHSRLSTFVRSLPQVDGQRCFIFATSGNPELRLWPYTRPLRRLLEAKGFEVVDTFSCRGFDTWLPLRLIGGINKGRPDAHDLDAARSFAVGLRDRLTGSPGARATRRSLAAGRGR